MLSVTVKLSVAVDPPAPSVTLGASTDSSGASSSSVIVISSLPTVRPVTVVVPVTDSVSPVPSSRVSWVGVRVKVSVPVSLPASTVSVKPSTVP